MITTVVQLAAVAIHGHIIFFLVMRLARLLSENFMREFILELSPEKYARCRH